MYESFFLRILSMDDFFLIDSQKNLIIHDDDYEYLSYI